METIMINGRPRRVPPATEAEPMDLSVGEELRVRTWEEYVGQIAMKENLTKRIKASYITGKPFDHMFLSAPPGYGKTSLCGIIALQLGLHFHQAKMTPSMKEREFSRLVLSLQRPCLFLIDEVHAAPRAVQELMMPMIDEGILQNKAGKVEPVEGIVFALATTEPQRCNKAMLSRIRIQPHFVDYSDEELAEIILGMARRIDVPITGALARELAPAAAFTPRIAGSLVTAARDIDAIGDPLTAENILTLAEFDPDGLSHHHLDYLRALDDLGGQSGIKNIAMMLQYPLTHIEDLERLLIKRNFITLEPVGRTITGHGMRKIGIDASKIRRTS